MLVNAINPSPRNEELRLINRTKNGSASLEVRMKLGQVRSVPRSMQSTAADSFAVIPSVLLPLLRKIK